MNIEWIIFKDSKILFLDLSSKTKNKVDSKILENFNDILMHSNDKVYVLVNVENFMPLPGFMEYATTTLNKRADKIIRAAYYGLNTSNKRLFELYNSFNYLIVDRQVFENRNEALNWLIH
jgi:hypothetical protein